MVIFKDDFEDISPLRDNPHENPSRFYYERVFPLRAESNYEDMSTYWMNEIIYAINHKIDLFASTDFTPSPAYYAELNEINRRVPEGLTLTRTRKIASSLAGQPSKKNKKL